MQATISPQAPFPQARFAAITQLAVFEAVNAIRRDYQPYLGTIAAPPDASPEAAAIAAAHAVLKNYFPGNALTLDAAELSSLAAIPDGAAKSAGIAVGEAAAAAMIAARLNDGSSPAAFYLPASTDPGQWRPTPGCTAAGGAFFHWQNVKLFGLGSAGQFLLPPPPPLASEVYARTYEEVKDVGAAVSADRPQDRVNVVLFYGRVPPAQVFNNVARQISAAKGRSLSENARDLALINMAISDAAVATFYTKYLYTYWRPETAIHDGGLDGNDRTVPDATFTPFFTAPCFPGYPSAHGTLGNAAREVMKALYGDGPFSITLSAAAVPGVTLNYTSLDQITNDVSDARVYGGIHFRTDQDAGASLGEHIGRHVYERWLRFAYGAGSNGQ